MALSSRAKTRWLLGALFFGLCTAMALLSSLGAYVSGMGVDQRMPLGPVFRQEFKDWYACGLLSLGVLWFCGQNRLETGNVKRWVLVHVAAACAFSVVGAIGTAWWIAGEESIQTPGKILTFSLLLKRMAL